MAEFSDIKDLHPDALTLLESSDFLDTDDLNNRHISIITRALDKTNKNIHSYNTTITDDIVLEWLKPMIEQDGVKIFTSQLIDDQDLVTYEDLTTSAFCVPVSDLFAKEHRINVKTLPKAALKFTSEENLSDALMPRSLKRNKSLDNQLSLDDEVPIPAPSSASASVAAKSNKPETPAAAATTTQEPIPTAANAAQASKKKLRHMSDLQNEKPKRASDSDSSARHDIRRSALAETNEGVPVHSRRFVRGVLSNFPKGTFYGALSLLFLQLSILVATVCIILLILSPEKYAYCKWLALLCPLALVLYVLVAPRASCPVCRQKQFLPKNCKKHGNAHFSAPLGYMTPTALHTIIFKWFRCIYCGTPIRIKK